MTPQPPPPPEGSPLSSRHRPPVGDLAKDTTEADLWAFDDDLDLPDEVAEPPARQANRPTNREIPEPRERAETKTPDREGRPTPKPGGGEEQIRMNVTKARPRNHPSGTASGAAVPESEFDDLEHWEDAKLEPELADLPATVLPVALPEPAAEEKPAAPAAAAAADSAPAAGPPPAAEETADDEFSPVFRENSVPVSLRPHLQLSKVERIGLIALLVLLVGGGATVFISSLNRLPVESVKAETTDFPIKGEHLTVTSAASYWRPPITEGPDADTFRRGTQLLPVLELAVSGGPAAIRVLFRNEDRAVIGDAVTRSIRGSDRLIVPATAGFDDPGMHAAYRTGESKPWTIEVYEAPSENAQGDEIRKLFEINISTDRR